MCNHPIILDWMLLNDQKLYNMQNKSLDTILEDILEI